MKPSPEHRATRPAFVACSHCGLPVDAGLVVPEAATQFCCAGCRAVYETIHACGLGGYYRLREAADAPLQPADPKLARFESFDTNTFHSLHVTRDAAGLSRCEFVLDSATCGACVWLIEKLPEVLPGVLEARLSLSAGSVTIAFDADRVKLSRVASLLDRLGYTPHVARGRDRAEIHRRRSRAMLIDIGIAFALMGNIMLICAAMYADMFGSMTPGFVKMFTWLGWGLGMISLAWPGRVFFVSSYRAIRSWTANLDLPITLALFVGAIAGTWNTITARGDFYFDSLSMLVFLLLVGRFIQYKQQRRAESSLEMLFALTPQTARRVERDGANEDIHEVPTQAIAPGDVIEIRSGELLPADGVVESGQSALNNALLTGESRPIDITIGSTVTAGSMNVGGVVRMRVSAAGEATRLGRLMKLVESGLCEKPQLIRFTDRIGRWFLPAVLLLGVITFAYGWPRNPEHAIDNTVAILIVTCPCVLGLAVPLTMGVTIGRLARQGTLVKSAAALERLASRSGGRVVLDKTGTITHGQLSLTRFSGDASIRPIVGRIESGSNHPIARAMVAEFGKAGIDVESTIEVSGGIEARCAGSDWLVGSQKFVVSRGVGISHELQRDLDEIRASGASAVVMVRDGRALAVAGLEDAPRADSAEAIVAMREMGWEVEILTGDHRQAADRVARQVGVDASQVHADVVAERKLDHVRRDDDSNDDRLTIMIGDGVNDSAALAAADVGIAVAGGAETSLAAADVYASSPGLMPTVRLMRACRRTMRILKINFGISLAYNILAGTLAIMGLMHPLLAAIIMPLSSVTVLSIGTAMVMRGIRPMAR